MRYVDVHVLCSWAYIIFQVVSTQHALTIVAMEKKLMVAITKISNLEAALAECRRVPSPGTVPHPNSQPSPTPSTRTSRSQSTTAPDEDREKTGLDSLDGQGNGQGTELAHQQAKMKQMEEELAKLEQVVKVLRCGT